MLAGGLTLSDPGSEISGATLGALDLAGTATRVRVDGTAELRDGALLRSASVTGQVHAAAGTSRLETVALDLAAGPGLRVACAAMLEARHVTLAGTPDAAVTTDCAASEARVRDSILWAPFAGPGTVVTSYSDYPAAAGHADGPGDQHVDPGFAPASLRLGPGSPLLDAGMPEPLGEAEWPQDRDELPRASDGDGDGSAVRDPGAYERPAAAVPPPAGNLLGDPGAEDGGAWTATDGFASERYGAFPFPSAAFAAVLGAGGSFFAGGPSPASSATQHVDLTGIAPEIDRGGATASLAGLLGGYRADADAGSVEATFLDPAGQPLGAPVALSAPTAAERANATTLLPRGRTDPIPPLARSVEVTLRAARATGAVQRRLLRQPRADRGRARRAAAAGRPRPGRAARQAVRRHPRADGRGDRRPRRQDRDAAGLRGRHGRRLRRRADARRRAAARRPAGAAGGSERLARAGRDAPGAPRADPPRAPRGAPPRPDPDDAVRRRPRRPGADARVDRPDHGAVAPALRGCLKTCDVSGTVVDRAGRRTNPEGNTNVFPRVRVAIRRSVHGRIRACRCFETASKPAANPRGARRPA